MKFRLQINPVDCLIRVNYETNGYDGLCLDAGVGVE